MHNVIYKDICTHAESLQSCLTLQDPMDCSPPGSSVHGILQVRILEWFVMTSSRESSWPRDRTHMSCVSCTAVDSLPLSHRGSLCKDMHARNIMTASKNAWPLVWGDPTCLGETGPLRHKHWARALAPTSHNHWVHMLQLLKLVHLEPVQEAVQKKPPKWEAREPKPESGPCSLQLETARIEQQRSSTAETK